MAEQALRWFEQRRDFVSTWRPSADGEAPSEGEQPDLFTKCPSCSEPLFNETLVANLQVCHLCQHHFRISAVARLRAMCDDPPAVTRHDADLSPVDALGFVDSKPYPKRIASSVEKTGRNDAFISLAGEVGGIDVELGAFDFAYLGGSMGSVVGEMITRLYERAYERKVPAIVISASGGARMQEGVLSLMQMAKTCAALARLQEAGLPYISVLTHPTTGGVAASFAMLGDVILAEPGALIGFAGPRVIRETIGEELPEGFQTSEYLLEHGLIDRIVPRLELKGVITRLLRQFTGMPPAPNGGLTRPTQPGVRSVAEPLEKPTASSSRKGKGKKSKARSGEGR
ncbi:MAG: acetyl-CoA carboxylase, carboxyltransferase subunit beta [Myxococcales bacterium]|nr:acetyl-CoA carboxylase, carboxyltransferase subunit beta [Myxococcales bacterium]